MLIVTGKKIFFFCTVRCRDNFDLRSGKNKRYGVESRQFELAEYNGPERRSIKDRR